MTNPKKELRDYLQILIHRLLYIKGINKQLKLIKEWETPRRIVALDIGSYFYKLVGFSFNRTLLIEFTVLMIVAFISTSLIKFKIIIAEINISNRIENSLNAII